MSQPLRHDPHKFSDSGLQLRLPVDLVPSGQYSRLSNALPVIEGEIRTREGMTLVAQPVATAFIYAMAGLFSTNSAILAHTVSPHGYRVGDTVTINISYLTTGTVPTLGAYPVTVTFVSDAFTFNFSPGIPWAGLSVAAVPIFAQATGAGFLNTLTNTSIDNIFRLNEAITALPGDRIVTSDGRIWHAPLPAGNVFEELVGPLAPGGPVPKLPIGFSGRPMAIAEFRFTLDSASWAIFADQNAMYKYRPGLTDSQIEFVPLGNAPPTVAATASAGSTGNPNSTGGSGYDWRYTYVDGLALTESNPSPIDMTSGGTSTTRPTTYTDPANTGDNLFISPANAYDGSTATASSGTAIADAVGSHGRGSDAVSCLWNGWAQPAGVVDSIVLNMLANLTVDASDDGGGADAHATASLSYSYDGGVTFNTLATINVDSPGGGSNTNTTGLKTYTVTIPSSVGFANIIVEAAGTATANGRTIAGEPSSASSDVTTLVYDINTTVVQEGSVNTLALTNQIGVICVKPSPFPQHTFINLYRRGGSLPDAWRLVSQSQVSTLTVGACGAGFLEIDDNVSDATLSTSSILQLDNDQPVTSVTKTNQPLSFIWGPVGFDVRLLGCGDPARPESVYFSKPGIADAWPPENYIEVSDPGTPIIAGCAFNTRNFAFSRESIFELVEGLGTGSTYTPFRTPSAHGVFSPWALAVGPAMYFVAKDGIYQSLGGRESSIVENDLKPLFPTYDTPGQSVNGYEAVDMTHPDDLRLRYHNDELYFLYIGMTTGTRQVLVYDIQKKRWRAIDADNGLSMVYTEPATVSSLLYGTSAGCIYQAGGSTDPLELEIIENAGIGPITVASSFTAGTQYVRMVRYTAAGAQGISYETAVVVSPTIGIIVTFPVAPAGTLKWRVLYGTTPGAENTYMEYTEASLAASRTVTITAVGTAGVVPTVNADPNISVVLRTGAHDQGAPLNQKQYGNVIFDLDPGGATVAAPVTITPYINGEVASEAALMVTGSGRQQVPLDLSDYFAFNTEYEITWESSLQAGAYTLPVLYQYDTLHFVEPAQLTHWQTQPTSFEFPGFVHVRDAYIALRSTAPVTLTVTIDAVTVQTYTIPSTGGQRLKVYVQFQSNKGLMYQFALDSAASFRTYSEDLEIRVKPWLGVLGYQIERTLGAEAGA